MRYRRSYICGNSAAFLIGSKAADERFNRTPDAIIKVVCISGIIVCVHGVASHSPFQSDFIYQVNYNI